MGGKSSSTPDAPDYRGAAEEQAQASETSLRNQTYANRPNQITPWGNVNWVAGTARDPASGEMVTDWTQQFRLNNDQQRALNDQTAVQAGRSDLALGMLDNAGDAYRQPFDWDSMGDMQDLEYNPDQLRQQASDAVYGQATSRLDPMWEQREQQTMIDLRNRGLREGDEAYDAAMANMGRDRNDAYATAQNAATSAGRAEAAQLYGQQLQTANYGNTMRQQQIAEQMQARGMGLNEINAVLYGQQVAQPNMPGFTSAGAAQSPQYLNAANMQGQFDIGSANAANAGQAGMFGGIGSMMSGAGALFSAF